MFKKSIPVVLASVGVVTLAGGARAQFLDMSQMVQNELNFQSQFYRWAWQGSLDVARHLRETGQQNPFNAMTIYQSNLEGQRAWEGYIRQFGINSQRSSQAVENWTNGAIRGIGPYYNPSSGHIVNLPWTHPQYHQNQYGQYVPGYNPARASLVPFHGR